MKILIITGKRGIFIILLLKSSIIAKDISMDSFYDKNSKDIVLPNRAAGILMPVFSLPSKYGIGTLGKAAFEFIDFLADANQHYWQVLPLNPTGFGDSPYSSCSVFAGNPYFIDLDMLVDEGFLKKKEIDSVDFRSNFRWVDYENLYKSRFSLLRIAAERANIRNNADYQAFVNKNIDWLEPYALFMSLKSQFAMNPWYLWKDSGARLNKSATIVKCRGLLAKEIEFHYFTQYVFYSQWEKVKTYAQSKSISIIGDIPIYCALDSADVWANRKQFQLDKCGKPVLVAGVPPDAFAQDGQLWGNPLYDWTYMKRDSYSWWLSRLEHAKNLFDVVRIDHFRALESYWAIPSTENTARGGQWVKGPGISFINTINKHFPDMSFIAEDLGCLTEDVHELRHASGFPGMKVLEFAFDPSGKSDYLPHNYDKNCVCYVGTHDNAPLFQYLKEVDETEKKFIAEYLGLNNKCDRVLGEAILRAGLASTACLFIAQMQDWLGLNSDCRINLPGTCDKNWTWRMKRGEANEKLASRIEKLTKLYGR